MENGIQLLKYIILVYAPRMLRKYSENLKEVLLGNDIYLYIHMYYNHR